MNSGSTSSVWRIGSAAVSKTAGQGSTPWAGAIGSKAIRIAGGVPNRRTTTARAAWAMNCAHLPVALGLAGFIACQPAFAGDTWSPWASTVQIVPSERCVAELVIYNDPEDLVSFSDGDVTRGGLTVHLHFERDVSPGAPDTFTATPPAGLIAIPESVTIMDGSSGSILICEAGGVGA